jgi:hypothetical protein
MFGSKKRKYQDQVASLIAAMSFPEDLDLAADKISLHLKDGFERFYLDSLHPMQAAMELNYIFLKNFHASKENLSTLIPDDVKVIMICACVTMIDVETSSVLSDSVKAEIIGLIDDLSPIAVGITKDVTFGQLIEFHRKKSSFVNNAMNRFNF